MTKPFTPEEAAKSHESVIPKEVFEVFNKLLATRFSGTEVVTIKMDEVAPLICEKLKVTRNQLANNGWLDIEPFYRKAGWDVEYDKPGFNETYYTSFWEFRPKEGRSPPPIIVPFA